MTKVGVARLKAELSRYLDAVRHGRVGQSLRRPPRGPKWVGEAALKALLDERAEGR
jgi:hypothetical protein